MEGATLVANTVRFFGCSPQFMYSWRRFLLRLFGAKIGENVLYRPTARVTYPWKLYVGDNSWIGDEVVLYSLGDISTQDNCVISQRSYLCTGSHDMTSISFDIYQKPIVIESGVWLATDVFVAPGVTVHKGAVIGSRSSVYKNMPENMVCLGTPARAVIKGAFDESFV